MRHYGSVQSTTPMATTVHSTQVVPDADVVMESHDTPLDYIATPDSLIETKTTIPRPGKLDWNAVREDQYRDIPFLRDLRGELG
jgi:5-formyltetrahydrofolate cyclo-ligase